MKNFMKFILVLVGTLVLSNAVAADKVVVIPLNSSKKLMNVVTVSAMGGDFTDPVAAVKSITNATSANPYLVIIGPGNYSLTKTIVMKPYVSITGAGQQATKLIGAMSIETLDVSSTVIFGSDNASLSNLAVENTGGDVYSVAIYNDTNSTIIHDVTAYASGGERNYGIVNSNCSPTIKNVTTSASGGTFSDGIFNKSSSPIITNVTASASLGGTSSAGVYNVDSSPIMTDVSFYASGGTTNYGVVDWENSSSIISECKIAGDTKGVKISAAATTRIIRSSIIGGVEGTGTISCVNSDNGIDKELNDSCEEIGP